MKRIPIEIRFWRKVHKGEANDCWIWKGGTNGVYGTLGAPGGRKTLYAHRLSWELANGRSIPEGLFIDHICRNKLCVNPQHLQLVTAWGNQHLSTDKTSATKTHCKNGHELLNARLVH